MTTAVTERFVHQGETYMVGPHECMKETKDFISKLDHYGGPAKHNKVVTGAQKKAIFFYFDTTVKDKAAQYKKLELKAKKVRPKESFRDTQNLRKGFAKATPTDKALFSNLLSELKDLGVDQTIPLDMVFLKKTKGGIERIPVLLDEHVAPLCYALSKEHDFEKALPDPGDDPDKTVVGWVVNRFHFNKEVLGYIVTTEPQVESTSNNINNDNDAEADDIIPIVEGGPRQPINHMMASMDADDDKKMPPSMELESTETGGAGAGAGAGGGADKVSPPEGLKGSTEFEQWDNRVDWKGGTATDKGFPECTLAAEMFQGFQGDDGVKAKQTLDFVEDFLLLDVDQRILAIRMFQEYPGDEATKVEETAKFVKGLLAKHEITEKISPEVREAYMSQHWGLNWKDFRPALINRTYIVRDGKLMWKVQKQGEAKKNFENNACSLLVDGEVYVPVPETRRLLYDGLKAEVQRRFPNRALKRDHLDTVRTEMNKGSVPFGIKNGGAIMALEANSEEFEAADEAYFGSKAPNNLQQDKPVLDTPLRPRSDGGLASGGGDVAAGGAGGGTPDSYDSGMARAELEEGLAEYAVEVEQQTMDIIQQSAVGVKSHVDAAVAASEEDKMKAENVEQDLMAGQQKNEEEYYAIVKGLHASRGDMSNRILKNQAVRLQGREETRQQGIQAMQGAHDTVAAQAQALGTAKKDRMRAMMQRQFLAAKKKVKNAAKTAMNSPKVLFNKTPSRRKAVTFDSPDAAAGITMTPAKKHEQVGHAATRQGNKVQELSSETPCLNQAMMATMEVQDASTMTPQKGVDRNTFFTPARASKVSGSSWGQHQQVQSPQDTVQPKSKKKWNPFRSKSPASATPQNPSVKPHPPAEVPLVEPADLDSGFVTPARSASVPALADNEDNKDAAPEKNWMLMSPPSDEDQEPTVTKPLSPASSPAQVVPKETLEVPGSSQEKQKQMPTGQSTIKVAPAGGSGSASFALADNEENKGAQKEHQMSSPKPPTGPPTGVRGGSGSASFAFAENKDNKGAAPKKLLKSPPNNPQAEPITTSPPSPPSSPGEEGMMSFSTTEDTLGATTPETMEGPNPDTETMEGSNPDTETTSTPAATTATDKAAEAKDTTPTKDSPPLCSDKEAKLGTGEGNVQAQYMATLADDVVQFRKGELKPMDGSTVLAWSLSRARLQGEIEFTGSPEEIRAKIHLLATALVPALTRVLKDKGMYVEDDTKQLQASETEEAEEEDTQTEGVVNKPASLKSDKASNQGPVATSNQEKAYFMGLAKGVFVVDKGKTKLSNMDAIFAHCRDLAEEICDVGVGRGFQIEIHQLERAFDNVYIEELMEVTDEIEWTGEAKRTDPEIMEAYATGMSQGVIAMVKVGGEFPKLDNSELLRRCEKHVRDLVGAGSGRVSHGIPINIDQLHRALIKDYNQAMEGVYVEPKEEAKTISVTAGSTETPPKQKQKKISAKSPIPQAVAAVKKFFSPKADTAMAPAGGPPAPTELTAKQRKQELKKEQRAISAKVRQEAKKQKRKMDQWKKMTPDTKEEEEAGNLHSINAEQFYDSNLCRRLEEDELEQGLFLFVQKVRTQKGGTSYSYYKGEYDKYDAGWHTVKCGEDVKIRNKDKMDHLKYDIKANAAAGRHAA